jgi:hypothetical protein
MRHRRELPAHQDGQIVARGKLEILVSDRLAEHARALRVVQLDHESVHAREPLLMIRSQDDALGSFDIDLQDRDSIESGALEESADVDRFDGRPLAGSSRSDGTRAFVALAERVSSEMTLSQAWDQTAERTAW